MKTSKKPKAKDVPMNELRQDLNKVNRIMTVLTNGKCYIQFCGDGVKTIVEKGCDLKPVLAIFDREEEKKLLPEEYFKKISQEERIKNFNDAMKSFERGITAKPSEDGAIGFDFENDLDEKIFIQFINDIMGVDMPGHKLLWASPKEVRLGETLFAIGCTPFSE